MQLAGRLINWWYDWGVFLFFFATVVLVAWTLYDAQQRRRSSVGWQLGVTLPALLLLPALIFRLNTGLLIANPGLVEPFFWIGLVGGLTTILAAIGYAITAEQAAAAPAPAPRPAPGLTRQAPAPARPPRRSDRATVRSQGRAQQRKANALLYMQAGPRADSDYRLNVGNTRIGRARDNDIYIDHDDVSREHALIKEEAGRFTLYDRGSTNGTYLNGQMVRGPMLLEDNDEIRLGDGIVLTFKAL